MPTVSDTIEGMHVKSRIGIRRQHDRFVASEAPTHEVSVENRNGEACDVEVEILSESGRVLVDGAQWWRSSRMTHGGLRSRRTRRWPYRATLAFTKKEPGRPQVVSIRIYMAPAWSKGKPLPLIGELKHTVWVS